MSDFYKIRDVEDEDLNAISNLASENGLLLEGLTPSIFSAMLKWLHSKSDVGKKIQILARVPTGVIGHYGGVPFKMKWHEKTVFATLASNLVVDKNYRKYSTFFGLQKEFIKSYQAKGYSFAYGAITREGVLNPHLRAGWKSLGSLHIHVRPISLNSIFGKLVNYPVISLLAKLPLKLLQKLWDAIFYLWKDSIHVIEETYFADSVSSSLEYWMQKKKICAERSIEALNWRFSAFQDRNYHIFIPYINSFPSGYLVVRLMPMKQFLSVAIVDLVVINDDKKVFNALMKHCILFARVSNADLIATALTDHDELRNLFRETGFFQSPNKFTVVGHFPKNGDIKFTEFQFSDFHINWFDHDYV